MKTRISEVVRESCKISGLNETCSEGLLIEILGWSRFQMARHSLAKNIFVDLWSIQDLDCFLHQKTLGRDSCFKKRSRWNKSRCSETNGKNFNNQFPALMCAWLFCLFSYFLIRVISDYSSLNEAQWSCCFIILYNCVLELELEMSLTLQRFSQTRTNSQGYRMRGHSFYINDLKYQTSFRSYTKNQFKNHIYKTTKPGVGTPLLDCWQQRGLQKTVNLRNTSPKEASEVSRNHEL